MEDVTFIIKTFVRKKCLLRLLESIYIYYPHQKIIIVDDSKKPLLLPFELLRIDLKIQYIHTDFNIGLSRGRNMLVDLVETKYFLLLDDDFILDRRSNISGALKVLERESADIVGGNCYDLHTKGQIFKRYFHGMLAKNQNILRCTTATDYDSRPVDFVLNFFLANTSAIQNLRWNAELNILEHIDFFWRAKQKGLCVYYYADMYTLHYSEMPKQYRKYRKDNKDKYSKILKEALGVSTILLDDKPIYG